MGQSGPGRSGQAARRSLGRGGTRFGACDPSGASGLGVSGSATISGTSLLGLPGSTGGGVLVRGVGERLPFAGGTFDLVLFFNSLPHVPPGAQAAALAEAARVLRTGGDLVVVEPPAGGPGFDLLGRQAGPRGS